MIVHSTLMLITFISRIKIVLVEIMFTQALVKMVATWSMGFLFIHILLLLLFDLILQSSFCLMCLIILAFNLSFKMNHTPLQWIFSTHALVTHIVVFYNIFFNTICPHVYSLDLSFLKHLVQVKMTQFLFSIYSSTTIFSYRNYTQWCFRSEPYHFNK